ncbi:hypothetical protein BH24ACT26_BH24ACT26_08810 [soil metagenome]
MAIQAEELRPREAVVVPFPAPTGGVRARRARMLARRRRFATVAVASFVFIATLVGGGGNGVAPASRPGAPGHVTVGTGDTLWDLAERYAPRGVDRRGYVDALVELNDLDGSLYPGTRVRLPR